MTEPFPFPNWARELGDLRKALEEERGRELARLKWENPILRKLHDSYVAQRARPDLKLPASSETSKETFTDAELVRAMRLYDDDIRRVAAFFNVSKGSIYNRLRGLAPGMIDGPESRRSSWPEGEQAKVQP